MSFKKKTALAPFVHMASLAALTDIIGPSLTTTDQLDRAIGAASVIPFMPLKPDQVAEVAEDITKKITEMKNDKTHDLALVSQLVERLVDASNQLINNNHQKQNGAGDSPAAYQPKTGQSTGARAS